MNRNNIPADSPYEYYKCNVAIPFLDHLINEISSRFTSSHAVAYKCLSIVPKFMRQQYSIAGQKRRHDSITVDNVGKQQIQENLCSTAVTIQRIDKPWKKDLLDFCIQFRNDMPNHAGLLHKVDNWESAWSECPDVCLPNTISETLQKTNKVAFPNMYTALVILIVLPITSCFCERSASSIRILKMYLRSTMSQKRLKMDF